MTKLWSSKLNMCILLVFTTLWANSADDIIFLILPENKIWNFMQIVSNRDSLHEMTNSASWEK